MDLNYWKVTWLIMVINLEIICVSMLARLVFFCYTVCLVNLFWSSVVISKGFFISLVNIPCVYSNTNGLYDLILSNILRSFEPSLTANGFLAILRKNLNLIH